MSPIRNAIQSVVNQLFGKDPNCMICGEDVFSPQFGMCTNCLETFPFADENLIGKVLTVARYEEPVKQLIYDYKYNDQRYLADYLAQMMAAIYLESGLEADVILPVPASEKRSRIRGFDHMAYLAERLSENLGISYETNALIRVKDTERLKGLSKSERLIELDQVFAVEREDAINGKRILLIDDILTTGSTLNACTEVLASYGPKSIHWLTFAAVL